MNNKVLALSAAVVLAMGIGSANAATVEVGNAEVPTTGGATTPAAVQVTYTGDADTVGWQCDVSFDTDVFDVTASPTAGSAGAADSCSVETVGPGIIRISDTDPALNPLGSGAACDLEFTAVGGLPLTAGDSYPLTLSNCLFGDNTGSPTAGPHTETPGAITVATPPADTAPTFTGTVTDIPSSPDPIIGRPSANGSIQFVGAGGEGASENTGSISCTAAAPFSITSGGTQSGLGNGDAAPVNFNCTPAAAAVSGNLSCSLNGGNAQTFDVTCPAGVEPPPVVRPEIVPASSHLSQLLLVILLGMFGMGAVYLVRRS